MATPKQTRAIMIYKKNYGSGITPTEAMRQAGYAESSLKNPKVLTESMDWKEAMDHFLPDNMLLEKHNELMNAKRLERAEFPAWMPEENIRKVLLDAGCQLRNYETNPVTQIISVWYWAPDSRGQAAALKMAYDLKGKMTTKVEHTGSMPVALVEFLGGDEPTDSQSPVSE